MQTMLVAHRDAAIAHALAQELQTLTGVPPTVLPARSDALHAALTAYAGAWVVVEVDLIPAVVPILRDGAHRVIAVSAIPGDPRAVKLQQLGVELVPPDQVGAVITRWLYPSPPAMTGEWMDKPQHDSSSEPYVVAVHSPKGGAGTSTIAAHLAAAWARQGRRTLLVDLAPYGAQAVLCKVQQKGTGLEALLRDCEASPALLDQADFDLSRYLTQLLQQPAPLHLFTGAAPRVLDRLQPEQVDRLLHLVRQLPFDRVVIDTGSAPDPRTLSVLPGADQVLVVATPDFSCGWNLVQLNEMLDVLGLRQPPLLLLNRETGSGGLTRDDLGDRLKTPVAAVLPEAGAVGRLCNQGTPWELPQDDPFMGPLLEVSALLDESREGALYG